jgi:hypothetical protein
VIGEGTKRVIWALIATALWVTGAYISAHASPPVPPSTGNVYDYDSRYHFELRAEVIKNGYVVVSERLNAKDYKTSGVCEKDGLLLGSPPPSKQVGDDFYNYTITCKQVKNT